jgi:rubredoxin
MMDTIHCWPEKPWDRQALAPGTRVQHHGAEATDDERDFGGGEYCVRWKCPNCGHTWWVELPQ